MIDLKNFVFVSLDHYKESIVRIIELTENIKEVLNELRSKTFNIGLFQISS